MIKTKYFCCKYSTVKLHFMVKYWGFRNFCKKGHTYEEYLMLIVNTIDLTVIKFLVFLSIQMTI